VRTRGPAEVDWEAGTVSVRAGAAVDMRLPGPEAARPAARRAAEKAGAERLAKALEKLTYSGGVRLSRAKAVQAAARAKTKDLEYQSNGGVLLTLEVAFDDLVQPPKPELEAKKVSARDKGDVDAERAVPDEPAEIRLSVTSMPLEVAPRVYSGGIDTTLLTAVYRLGEAPKTGARVFSAKRDRQGRLTFTSPAPVVRQLASGAHATIFLRTVGR